MVRLFGGGGEWVARSVEAETEITTVAVMAPIRANEENPAKKGLQVPLSPRSMDRRASAVGTPRMMWIEVGEIHGWTFPGRGEHSSAKF